MRMSRDEFLRWENKAITLLGMSGVGKTALANKLPKCGWFHFSGDYRIGTRYLEEPILDNIKKQAMKVDFLRDMLRNDSIYIRSNITVHNLEPISTFLGKIGNPAQGGLTLTEFKRRQRLHREAEINAMRDVETFIAKSREIYDYPHFINDAGGSICELNDPETLEVLSRNTLILYLRADQEIEEKLIQRQVDNPKPLYYQEAFFDARLAEYLELEELESVEAIEPDRFVRWIFPRLVEHRKPLYQALADRYGYTVEASDVERVGGEADFLDLVGTAIENGQAVA